MTATYEPGDHVRLANDYRDPAAGYFQPKGTQGVVIEAREHPGVGGHEFLVQLVTDDSPTWWDAAEIEPIP